jgi:hypothetical protein
MGDAQPHPPPLRQPAPSRLARLLRRLPCRHDRRARVAEGWLSLLKKPPQILEETFDKLVADKGTGQDDTKSSN